MARAIIRYSAAASAKRLRGDIKKAMNPKGMPVVFKERGTALYEANDPPLAEIAKALEGIAGVIEKYAGPSPNALDHLWVYLDNPPDYMPSVSAPVTAPELARTLGLDAKWLRELIRKHRLVPSHRYGARYYLDESDVARIRSHPAVRQAVDHRR
jgi:hypothetical protein